MLSSLRSHLFVFALLGSTRRAKTIWRGLLDCGSEPNLRRI